MDAGHSGKTLLLILIIFGLNPHTPSASKVEKDAKNELNAEKQHNWLIGEKRETKSDQHRIVGGVAVEPGEFPYVVSLRYKRTSRHFCGGSLFSLQHVLTACHCLVKYRSQYPSNNARPDVKSPRSTEVYAGSLEIAGFDGYKRTGKKTIIYPLCKKNRTGWHYDVGVLITSPFVNEQSKVEPAPLPSFPNRTMLRYLISYGGGITCYAVGWGSTYEKGPFANVLLKVRLEMRTQETCNSLINYYAKTHFSSFEFDSDSQICAYGGLGKDACQGDSGSPLICEAAGVPMILGVVSWGFGCAREVPAVYARIDEIKPWLEKVIEDDKAAVGAKSLSAASLVLLACLMKHFV